MMMMMKRKKVDGLMSSTYTLPLPLLTFTTTIPYTRPSMWCSTTEYYTSMDGFLFYNTRLWLQSYSPFVQVCAFPKYYRGRKGGWEEEKKRTFEWMNTFYLQWFLCRALLHYNTAGVYFPPWKSRIQIAPWRLHGSLSFVIYLVLCRLLSHVLPSKHARNCLDKLVPMLSATSTLAPNSTEWVPEGNAVRITNAYKYTRFLSLSFSDTHTFILSWKLGL